MVLKSTLLFPPACFVLSLLLNVYSLDQLLLIRLVVLCMVALSQWVIFYAVFIILLNLKGPKLTCLCSQVSCSVGKANHWRRYEVQLGSRAGGCESTMNAFFWWDVSLGTELCLPWIIPCCQEALPRRASVHHFLFSPCAVNCRRGLPFSSSSTGIGSDPWSPWILKEISKMQKGRLDSPCKVALPQCTWPYMLH